MATQPMATQPMAIQPMAIVILRTMSFPIVTLVAILHQWRN